MEFCETVIFLYVDSHEYSKNILIQVSTWVRCTLVVHPTLPTFFVGQICTAGSRIFVQEGIYSEFLKKFTVVAQALGAATGDPFALNTQHGPQVSQTQFDVRYLVYLANRC